MMLRRRLFNKKAKTTYINLTADASGYIGKAAIPVKKDSVVKVTWDISNLSEITNLMTILSLRSQINSFGDVNCIPSSASTGYPILSKQFHSDVVEGGTFQFTAITTNLIVYVSCWDASEYEGTSTNRLVKTAFINFEIKEG